MTYRHEKCPACQEKGALVTKDGESVLVCENADCRVFTYAIYWG